MKEFGLQIFSVRDHFTNIEDTRAALIALGEMGYSSIHTAGAYDYMAPELFAEYVREAGLTVCGTHYDYYKIVGDIEGTIRYHETLGTRVIGIGGLPRENRVSEEKVLEFIEEFNKAARIYAKRGFKLTYHNHDFEFVKFDNGKTIFDLLEAGLDTNISFVLDAFWCQYAGIDVRDIIERLGERIEVLHLKDMTADKEHNGDYKYPMVEIGKGVMNYKGIIKTAERVGVKHFIVEDDRCFPGKSLLFAKNSADYIKENLIEK